MHDKVLQETPPGSPSLPHGVEIEEIDEDMHLLDENDIVEVLDDTNMNGIISDPDESSDEQESERVEENVIIKEVVEDEDREQTPERDDSQLTFTGHSKGVLCCEFHPKNNNIVASGGMDDTAYLWDCENGNKLFTCEGHEESVEVVTFSHDGNYLATADLNGMIKVWRMRDYKLINTFELEDELGWLQWHPGTNVLAASSQNGMIYLYKIPSGDIKVVISSFGQSCLAGKILPDGTSLACGFKDGCLKIVDLKQGVVLKDVKLFEEMGGITCLDVHRTNHLILCGCTTGAVILINSSSGKIVSILQGVKNCDDNCFIEAVSFCKESSHQLAASGSLDGELIIWDIIKQTLRHRHKFSFCINHLAWHPNLPLIFTCHFEGVVRAYDAKAGIIVKEYLGHKKSCLNMSLSRNGSILMTTSEDKTVRIFSVGNVL